MKPTLLFNEELRVYQLPCVLSFMLLISLVHDEMMTAVFPPLS